MNVKIICAAFKCKTDLGHTEEEKVQSQAKPSSRSDVLSIVNSNLNI